MTSRLKRSVLLSIAVGSLAVLVLLGLFTDVLRSPRAVVGSAFGQLLQPLEGELRFLVDVQADPARVGKRAHHLQFRAGPGPLLLSSTLRPQASVPFRLSLDQRGLTLTFRGSAIVRDGAGYLQLQEMPPYGILRRALEGRWIQLGERREGTMMGGDAGRKEVRRVVREALSARVVSKVTRGSVVDIRGVRARSYRLQVDESALQNFLDRVAGKTDQPEAVRAVARFLTGRLRVLRIEQAEVWVRPRSHTLVRARLVLVPKEASAEVKKVILDATLLPQRGSKVPPVPKGAVRLRPETLQRIISP